MKTFFKAKGGNPFLELGRLPYFIIIFLLAMALNIFITDARLDFDEQRYPPLTAAIFFAFVLGGTLLYVGNEKFKLGRTIEDAPASKISSGALGTYVAIQGRIINDHENNLIAPLSGVPCVFYRYLIRLGRIGGISADLFSSNEVTIKDGTGSKAKVLINLAEIITNKTSKIDIVAQIDSPVPERFYKFLKDNRIELLDPSSNPMYRIGSTYKVHEDVFKPDDQIYVLGFAQSPFKSPKRVKKTPFAIFKKAKQLIQGDPELQKRFDANQDGKLDFNELEQGAAVLGREMHSKNRKESVEPPMPDCKMVFKKTDARHPFVVSNIKYQWNLAKKVRRGSTWMIVVGAMLVSVAMVMLISVTMEM